MGVKYNFEANNEVIKLNEKIINGDCIEEMKKLDENSVDAIVTDPPYNVVQKMGGHIHLFRQAEQDGTNNYSKATMAYDIGFNQISWIREAIRVLKKGGNIIIFNDWENMGEIAKELRRLKINVKSLNHWQKTNPQPAEWRRRFVTGREYFLWGVKNGKYVFNVDKLHKGVFEMGLTKGSEKKCGNHPNQKPVQLMCELISILTKEGTTILDPFTGSGTTGIACAKLNRKFIGIEKEEEYVKIAKARIKPFEEQEKLL